MSQDLAAVFTAAADLLERDGWCQGEYEDGEGRRCAAGAISCVTTGDDDAYALARGALRAATNGRIAIWNDDPARTKAEVIGLLRDLADGAK